MFVPGTTAQRSAIVHETRFPLIVLERHEVALDPLLLDDARDELLHDSPPGAPWRWGYLFGVDSERGTHPAAVRLSRVVRERLAAPAFSLSFVKLAVGTPPTEAEGPLYEGPHLDSHPALTDSTELLRLLVNLSEHPRRFLYAATDRWRLGVRSGRREFAPLALPPQVERRVVVIPGPMSTTVHALRFLASVVPHVGLNDPPEQFLLSLEALTGS